MEATLSSHGAHHHPQKQALARGREGVAERQEGRDADGGWGALGREGLGVLKFGKQNTSVMGGAGGSWDPVEFMGSFVPLFVSLPP